LLVIYYTVNRRCELVLCKSHGRGILKKSIEEPLDVVEKKIHPPFHLARRTYPYVLLKYSPKKVGYVRCDSRGIFFCTKIHGVPTRKKKNPSRWNIRVFMGVYDFYSIVKSIDLIDTCPKKNNPCTGLYIRSKIFVSHLIYLLYCIVWTYLSLEREEAKTLHCNANSNAPHPSPKEE